MLFNFVQTAMFREKCLSYGYGALSDASVTRFSKQVASGLTVSSG